MHELNDCSTTDMGKDPYVELGESLTRNCTLTSLEPTGSNISYVYFMLGRLGRVNGRILSPSTTQLHIPEVTQEHDNTRVNCILHERSIDQWLIHVKRTMII